MGCASGVGRGSAGRGIESATGVRGRRRRVARPARAHGSDEGHRAVAFSNPTRMSQVNCLA